MELSARTIRARGDPSTPDTFGLRDAAQGVSRFTTTPARDNEFRMCRPAKLLNAASAHGRGRSQPVENTSEKDAFRKKTVATALFT
jgi:hypothetical protein